MKISDITQNSQADQITEDRRYYPQDINEIGPGAVVIGGIAAFGAADSGYTIYKAYKKFEASDRGDAALDDFKSSVGQEAAAAAIGAMTGGAFKVGQVLSKYALKGGGKAATKAWNKLWGNKPKPPKPGSTPPTNPGVVGKDSAGNNIVKSNKGNSKVAGTDGKATANSPVGKVTPIKPVKVKKPSSGIVGGAVVGGAIAPTVYRAYQAKQLADKNAFDNLDKEKNPEGSQAWNDAKYKQERARLRKDLVYKKQLGDPSKVTGRSSAQGN